jgi:hypothetical protein
MREVVVTLSGFEKKEKENIAALIAVLGATYLPILKLRSTTHLICSDPSGEKYEKANATGTIRLVSLEWLKRCALTGYLADPDSFPVVGVKAAIVDRDIAGDANVPNRPSPQSEVPPPADSAVCDGLDSECLAAHPDQNPLVQSRSQTDTRAGAMVKIELKKEKSDPIPSAPAKILSGVVIYVSKALASQEAILLEIAADLGATYRWVFDQFVTHVVHKGKRSQYKEVKDASISPHCFVVSPQWLRACKSMGFRLREDAYPPEVNAAKGLLEIDVGGTDSSSTQLSQFIKPPSTFLFSYSYLIEFDLKAIATRKEDISRNAKSIEEDKDFRRRQGKLAQQIYPGRCQCIARGSI